LVHKTIFFCLILSCLIFSVLYSLTSKTPLR